MLQSAVLIFGTSKDYPVSVSSASVDQCEFHSQQVILQAKQFQQWLKKLSILILIAVLCLSVCLIFEKFFYSDWIPPSWRQTEVEIFVAHTATTPRTHIWFYFTAQSAWSLCSRQTYHLQECSTKSKLDQFLWTCLLSLHIFIVTADPLILRQQLFEFLAHPLVPLQWNFCLGTAKRWACGCPHRGSWFTSQLIY